MTRIYAYLPQSHWTIFFLLYFSELKTPYFKYFLFYIFYVNWIQFIKKTLYSYYKNFASKLWQYVQACNNYKFISLTVKKTFKRFIEFFTNYFLLYFRSPNWRFKQTFLNTCCPSSFYRLSSLLSTICKRFT